MKKTYTSKDIDVYFEPHKCIHKAACVNGLSKVFDTEKRPWIDPEQASAEEIAHVVEECPSGALTYLRKDGGPAESHDHTEITVGEDGEFYIKGNFTLKNDGEETKLHRAVLWGSDEANNPPFYDRSLSER